jgi:hypothetical protein
MQTPLWEACDESRAMRLERSESQRLLALAGDVG